MTPALLDDVLAFADHFGITLYPWQREAFGRACRRVGERFVYRLAGVSVPRGNGKSFGGAVVGLWRLLAGSPPQDVISAALDLDGAKIVLDHARTIVRGHPALSDAVEVQANGLYVPSTGSRWTVTSREHTASRGRHPSLVIYDEVGWAKDEELFSSLLAGQASVADHALTRHLDGGTAAIGAAVERQAARGRRRHRDVLALDGRQPEPARHDGLPRPTATHPVAAAVCS